MFQCPISLFSAHRVSHRDAYAGGQEGQQLPLPSSMGAGGTRIALDTELFPSLLSSKGAFFGIVDSLVQENFSEGKPPDPQITVVLLGDQYNKHCFSGKSLKTKSSPVEEHIYAYHAPFCPKYAQASLVPHEGK